MLGVFPEEPTEGNLTHHMPNAATQPKQYQ